jgi:hypothetical protein
MLARPLQGEGRVGEHHTEIIPHAYVHILYKEQC